MMTEFSIESCPDDSLRSSNRNGSAGYVDATQSEALCQNEPSLLNGTSENETNQDELFGIGGWYPHCLQKLSRPGVFVALLCFFTTCDAFFSGIQVALLTTLETRYGLSAYQIGMVVTINKIGTMLGLPVAAYFGGRPGCHRPRYLAGSAFVMSIGMVMTCIPQFFFGPYQYHHAKSTGSSDFDLCSANMTNISPSSPNSECIKNTSAENRAAYIIILFFQFVVGVGYAPTRPLGVSYIDDNVKPNRAGFYLGIVSSMYGLGVVLGFLSSSATSLIWVDFYRTETALTQKDQAWVSAWWILFLFLGFVLIISGIPFLAFPKRLPRKWQEDKEKEPSTDGSASGIAVSLHDCARAVENENVEVSLSTLKPGGITDIFHALRRISSNGSYLLASFAFITSGLMTGIMSFFPKYMESQFGLTTSVVNVCAAIVISALGMGSILGGYLCRRWKLMMIGQIKLCLVCVTVVTCLQALLFAFGCQNQAIAGIHVDYAGNSLMYANLTSSCNKDCECSQEVFHPVCWEAGGVTYTSPCHAGCVLQHEVKGSKEFLNCSCVSDIIVSSHDELHKTPTAAEYNVQQGMCAYQCHTLVPFLIGLVVLILVLSTETAPLILTVLRSVNSKDKSFAYGITKCLQYVIGVIPTPVITGALIDTTCLFWQFECGDRGACWIHDQPGFRYIIGGSGLFVLLLQGMLLTLCWYFSRKTSKYQSIARCEESSSQLSDFLRNNVELGRQ